MARRFQQTSDDAETNAVRHLIRFFGIQVLCATLLVLVGTAPLFAQEKSVKPGINEAFQDVDVEKFIGRFENEGRDAYDHRHQIVKACQLKPGMVVADIGAGTGLFTRMFSPLVGPTGRIYAVDISEKFLKHIESTAQEQGLKNITGVVCKQDSVNLPPNSIDLAFICDTYHHFEFPHKTMESIHRALKPGGQLILIDFHRIEGVSREWLMTHVRAGQEVFTQEILESGFKQVEEKKDMLDESYFVRFEKTSPPELKLLLRGKGESEIAPHGKGNIYAPDVMVDDGLFKMWYGCQGKDGHDRISYAESKDGEHWIRKGVVLSNGTANHVNDPSVIKVDGVYYMFYTRAEKDVIDQIDVATSKDGLNWETNGVALSPGAAGQWDALSVGRPTVLYEDGQFKMWYDGRKDFPLHSPVSNVPKSSKSRRDIGYATSRDGLHWVRHNNNPVFGRNAGGVDVKRLGDKLVLLYESGKGTHWASSPDGLQWRDLGLLAEKSGQETDAYGHVTPNLLPNATEHVHHLYIGTAPAPTWDHNQISVLHFDKEHLNRLLESQE
ncbi:methyltransferase domain-containing protein [Symmachiella dynata]|uniref:methyltransferase domain-containing protein n=1 Tax=Symmachiella dynata TaxID=2527995 RepID=UPI0018D311A2|nr:methyltransferase domain-containing protein [Symmachiella dynata]